MTLSDQYDLFAADYAWLYSDRMLSGERFAESSRDLVDMLPQQARILDCACGVGVQALGLRRRGYDVEGTDASAGMIREAERRALAEGLDVRFSVCGWRELPAVMASRFDLVFCRGNAIGHCSDADEMVASFQAMRAVLKPGGILNLDSRNWEKLRVEQPRFQAMGARCREGKRCIPLYVWSFPPRWQDPHLIEVVLIFEEGGGVYHRSYPITYYPVRHCELVERLTGAGFGNIESDYVAGSDGYTVTARNGGR